MNENISESRHPFQIIVKVLRYNLFIAQYFKNIGVAFRFRIITVSYDIISYIK